MSEPVIRVDDAMYELMKDHFAWCDQQLKALFPGLKFGTANANPKAEPGPAGGKE